MKKTETCIDRLFITILKKLNYRVDGKRKSVKENWIAYALLIFSIAMISFEFWILKKVTLPLFLLNLISLIKRMFGYAAEHNKLKEEYFRKGQYDSTRKSSYELVLYILITVIAVLAVLGVIVFGVYTKFDSASSRMFFLAVIVVNMVLNFITNVFNALIILYQAQASFGEV